MKIFKYFKKRFFLLVMGLLFSFVYFCNMGQVEREAVDLGLSVKWATCNVGASSPEEYGSYYAWGETEEKSDYSGITYKLCNGSGASLTKYCTQKDYGIVDNKTVLEYEDDVVHVNWGGNWRMPTSYEFEELLDECTWVWTAQKGVNGYIVIGPNGNRIFLPAAGYRSGVDLIDERRFACYWSKTLSKNRTYRALELFFHDDGCALGDGSDRYLGFTIRPVTE